MRITQGTFSYLPDLSDDEIARQVQYCIDNDWPVSIEYTTDPHPRNVYWEMWGTPHFDEVSPSNVMASLAACRKAAPDHYIKVSAFDRSYGRQTTAISFIVSRPADEGSLRLTRTDVEDRRQRYGVSHVPGAVHAHRNGAER
jgi:ribulose-bisphosphate carboxylase small chain